MKFFKRWEERKMKMKKVLYITANPKTEDSSYSLNAGQKFVEAYKKANPKDEIIALDLYKMTLPMIDSDVLEGWGALQGGTEFGDLEPAMQGKIMGINQLTDQFIGADKYIFASPMWNLSLPPMLKAYVDTFVIAGKTFKYTEKGPVGLLENKKAIHIYATGGMYSEGPAKEFEFGNKYLKGILGFVGVYDFNTIWIEGTAMAQEPESLRNKVKDSVLKAVREF